MWLCILQEMSLYNYTSSGQTRCITRAPASPLPKAISFLFVNRKRWAGIQIKHKRKPFLPKGFTAFKRFKTDLPKRSQGWELNDFLLTRTFRINTLFSAWSRTMEEQRERQIFGDSLSNDVGVHPVPCNLHVDVTKTLSPHVSDVTVSGHVTIKSFF